MKATNQFIENKGEKFPLFYKYIGHVNAQSAYLQLDTESGAITADCDSMYTCSKYPSGTVTSLMVESLKHQFKCPVQCVLSEYYYDTGDCNTLYYVPITFKKQDIKRFLKSAIK